MSTFFRCCQNIFGGQGCLSPHLEKSVHTPLLSVTVDDCCRESVSKNINSYNDAEDVQPTYQLNSETAEVENAPASFISAGDQLNNGADGAASKESTKEFSAISTVEQTSHLQSQLKTSSDVTLLGCSRVDSIKKKQSVGYTRWLYIIIIYLP